MADRAKVVESVQVGDETTAGTAVAADKTLRAVSIETKVPAQADMYRPDGHKFNALSALNMEWSQLNLSGKPTYTELLYPLMMMFGLPSASTVGSTGKKYVFDMSDTSLLTPKTLTIEKGNSVRAQKIAGAALTDLGLTFSRKNGVGITGQGLGRLFTDGITLTASPSDVSLVPIVGKQLDVYIDAAAADLGTTQMLRAFAIEPQITGVFGPIWAIDSSQSSFTGLVDLAPTTSCKVTLEADAAGMAYLSNFRADDTFFLRVSGTGPVIEAGTPDVTYELFYDVCLGIKSIDPDNDEDGVTVISYDCEFVKDSTWGKALEITLQNDIASV